MKVYIVKSFSPENGWCNLKAFDNNDAAVDFVDEVENQIPDGIENEYVEIEVLEVRS